MCKTQERKAMEWNEKDRWLGEAAVEPDGDWADDVDGQALAPIRFARSLIRRFLSIASAILARPCAIAINPASGLGLIDCYFRVKK